MPALSQQLPALGERATCSAADRVETAKAADLRYVSDRQPGIQRKRVGKHFSYIGLDRKPIRDPQELERIKHIGIPPAWKQVSICPSPKGHIQSTGRDAKGRSSTAIILVGVRCAMRPSMIA